MKFRYDGLGAHTQGLYHTKQNNSKKRTQLGRGDESSIFFCFFFLAHFMNLRGRNLFYFNCKVVAELTRLACSVLSQLCSLDSWFSVLLNSQICAVRNTVLRVNFFSAFIRVRVLQTAKYFFSNFFFFFFLISVSLMKNVFTQIMFTRSFGKFYSEFLQNRTGPDTIDCLSLRENVVLVHRFDNLKKKNKIYMIIHTFQLIENAIADSTNYNNDAIVLYEFS